MIVRDVAAVVLAAGASRRLGRPKQLLPWGGRLLVRAVADEACAVFARVAVVVGADASRVARAVAGARVERLANPQWAEGVASSVRAGVRWASQTMCDAVLLLVCDQPRLDRVHLERLAGEWRRTGLPVGSRYAGIVGVPAVFPRTLYPSLLRLEGDTGARHVLRQRGALAIDWPAGALDVDTPEDAALLV